MSMPAAPEEAFNKDHAAAYDDRWKPLSPVSAALHLLIRGAFEDLPEDARILCAGAGTGAELLYLAKIFPGWRFVGFDPAEAMIEICRRRVEEAGVAERCELHCCYADALPQSGPFDAATSILVSHFLTDAKDRASYFRSLAERLRPGGLFVNADLAPDKKDAVYRERMDIWLATIAIAGMTGEARQRYEAMFGEAVAAHAPHEVETMIAENGFSAPVRFYQAAMIYGWFCRRL